MKPVSITLLFAMCSALVLVPILHFQNEFMLWPAAQNLFLCLSFAGYSILLSRWSNTAVIEIAFPVLLMPIITLTSQPQFITVIILLGLFCWVRSGICYKALQLRAFIAEITAISGGAGLALFWETSSILLLPCTIWFFFLVQCLYFYMIPVSQPRDDDAGITTDAFEQAYHEAERLFESTAVS